MGSIPSLQQTDAKSPINVLLMQDGIRDNLGGSFIGQVAPFYDFNGLLDIPAGYMWCNADQVTEANYNTIHGAGKWAVDVGSTALENKHLPNLNDDSYPVGAAATQAGTSAITAVGNTDHESTISHTHKWMDYQANYSSTYDRNQTYNSSGSLVNIPSVVSTHGAANNTFFTFATDDDLNNGGPVKWTSTTATGSYPVVDDVYTDNSSGNQDVQPESYAVRYIIKIV